MMHSFNGSIFKTMFKQWILTHLAIKPHDILGVYQLSFIFWKFDCRIYLQNKFICVSQLVKLLFQAYVSNVS